MNGKLLAGAVIAGLLVAVAVAGPWVAPYDPNRQDLGAIRVAPLWVHGGGWAHPLGTDSLGRDVLSRLLWGGRVALIVAAASALISALVGVPVALVAGYWRGYVDTVLMRLVDIWMSIPAVLLAIALMAVLGLGLWKVVLAIVIVDWTRFARVIRGEVLALREREFVEAARALGLGPLRVMLEELLPNVVPLIIVLASLEMAIAVGVEALLSFVGLGVQASVPSWGAMIAEGRGYLMVSWWGMGLPMLALIVAVVGFNLLGEGLRERLDPRLRPAA
ncbi:MAG: ABC transporter permease [Candidatus Rokubacteria bacterium]|nr:ABC transporter permease [Candidatus Rokubacteria bacterium]